jgi:guanine nucleotide-binding protein subunit alpha, other
MRLIHRVPFTPQEIESYRQLVFNNLTHGLKYVLDAMGDMELKVSEENIPYVDLIENAHDIRDGEPFPRRFLEPLRCLWADPSVQQTWSRGNEAALPEKCEFVCPEGR